MYNVMYNVIETAGVSGTYRTLRQAQLAAYIGGRDFHGFLPRVVRVRDGKEFPIPRRMTVTAAPDNGARFMVTR